MLIVWGTVGSLTMTWANLLSKAESFSMFSRYSLSVVACKRWDGVSLGHLVKGEWAGRTHSDTSQLSSGENRFEQVRRVHSITSLAGHDQMHLCNKTKNKCRFSKNVRTRREWMDRSAPSMNKMIP